MSTVSRLSIVPMLACSLSSALMAQDTPRPTSCNLISQPTTRLSVDSLPGGQQVAFVGGGVPIKCPSRGITLRGDSAERYPERDYLIGHVSYDEPRFKV